MIYIFFTLGTRQFALFTDTIYWNLINTVASRSADIVGVKTLSRFAGSTGINCTWASITVRITIKTLASSLIVDLSVFSTNWSTRVHDWIISHIRLTGGASLGCT